MFVCDKNWSCIGCNYQYADRLDQINEEFKDCNNLIEVEPVKHGKWVHRKGGVHFPFMCSLCGEASPSNEYQYCHCGAKMDLQ